MTIRAPGQVAVRHAGFTLVEMVIVIVLLGIIGSIVAVFITRPVESYVDLSRRAALVDAAESALRRIERDINIALPNSVRITNLGSGYALELLPTLDGGKYDFQGGGANNCGSAANSERLRFGAGGDSNFDIVGGFHNVTPGAYTDYRIVVNNQGTIGNNVYTASGSPAVMTPLGTTITITRPASAYVPCPGNAANDHVNLSVAHQFNSSATNRRLYVVTTPVSYLCDTTGGSLVRYYNYAINSSQPIAAADFVALNASSALIADRVANCSLTTTTSDVRNRSLVTLVLSTAEDGEQIRLIHQVPLDNSR